MKRIVFLCCLPLLLPFFSCDKVKTPIQKNTGSIDSVTYVRKVLLEDYTGHQCGNCPAAALVAEDLYEDNKDKVVVIAIHAGFFAKVNSTYPTSHTTTVGNDWDGNGTNSGFAISISGNPNGMVNRKNYGSGLVQKEDKWPTYVSQAMNDPYILGLDVKASYNPSTRILNTTIKAGFKNAYPNPLKLSVVLIEDSIIDDQMDYSKTEKHVPDYVFMHMLRGAINGSWGSDLKNSSDGPILENDTITASFSNFAIDSKFNDKHLSIVAFAYDAQSKEVLQVEKVKIK